MRKALSLFLALLACCLCLTSCGTRIMLRDTVIGSDREGVSLALLDLEQTGTGENLKTVWRNETDLTLHYGELYTIEYKNGDVWENLSPYPNGIERESKALDKNRSSYESYPLKYFDLSQVGTYRLSVSFSLEEGQDATEGTAWVEFEIKDKSKLKSYSVTVPEADREFIYKMPRRRYKEGDKVIIEAAALTCAGLVGYVNGERIGGGRHETDKNGRMYVVFSFIMPSEDVTFTLGIEGGM